MIQLQAVPGVPVVRAAACWRRPAAEVAPQATPPGVPLPTRRRLVLRDRLQQLLAESPFCGRRVVAAVPKELLQVRTVRLPAGTADVGPIDPTSLAAAEGVAQALFPFELRDAVVQVLPAGRVGRAGDARWELIVLAAPRRELDGFVADLHAAGLVVESLDAEPCALYRAVAAGGRGAGRGDEFPARVLIDVGRRRTQVVMGRGGGVTFIKPIEVGAEHLEQAVVRKLGVTPAEARLVHRRSPGPAPDAVRQALTDATRGAVEQFARGLSAYLRYHAVTFRGPGPDRVSLVGGQADNEILCASLSALLGLPVVPGDPLAALDLTAVPARDRAAGGAWAVAVGLALKKLARRADEADRAGA